jgi:hypothetical protein
MLVTTTKGVMESEELEMREGALDDDNELTRWVEYWKDDELVHRSVHIELKKPLVSISALGEF